MATKVTGVQYVLKKYGDKAIRRLGDSFIDVTPAIPTGSLALDLALGVGGIPRGRVTEIFGPEESAKTSICLGAVRSVQQMGGKALYIDMEQGLDLYWAQTSGVDTEALFVSQPDYGEEALDIAEACLGEFDIIIIDSVSALVPRAEVEGDMGDAHMGIQARLMGQALRKIGPKVRKTGTALVFINQVRLKIGVVFGNPETTSGGKALRFYASVRMRTKRGAILKRGDTAYGVKIRADIKKNKVAPPYALAEFTILFDRGVSNVDDLMVLGEALGLLSNSGRGHYTIFPEGFGSPSPSRIADIRVHGEAKLRDYLLEQEETAMLFESAIRSQYGLPLVQLKGD